MPDFPGAIDPALIHPRQWIAERRIRNILGRYIVANERTLEQKISDAGPNNQRIDPHILTQALHRLREAELVSTMWAAGTPWYHLPDTDAAAVNGRLNALLAVYSQPTAPGFGHLLGQALEIAVYRALNDPHTRPLDFFGGFEGLEAHDDSTLYKKLEPPSLRSGRSIAPKHLDFLVHFEGVYAGVEVKNTRPWLYPDRDEIHALLWKCCRLDVVPVLIARRIHYSTFSVFNSSGLILHETYNQLYPASAEVLASQARDKNLLGYHDIRSGNLPDARLIRFIQKNLPRLLPEARRSFEDNFDLLSAYASGDMSYAEFSGRSKRRLRGEPEDLPRLDGSEWG